MTILRFSLVFAVLLANGCSTSDPPGRTLPADGPVAFTSSDRPGVEFHGWAMLELTTIAYHGIGDGQLHVVAHGDSPSKDEWMHLDVSLPLESARRLLSGERILQPAGDVMLPRSSDSVPGGGVESMTLGLTEATFDLTVVVDDGNASTLTARGQFAVNCSQEAPSGETLTDSRWETPFCADTRAAIALDPWIAAAR